MSKKFVRGITNVKDINKQDFDTNNVNDLLSDGENNYIHRKKKDKSEEYHNLTDNLKTLSSDDTNLLTVTNYNKTSNSATLHPKHDELKEQILTSPNRTLTFKRGSNGTNETTKVDISEDLLNTINKNTEEITKLNEKQPLFHHVSEVAGGQLFNMQTTQTYNFDSIEIFTRIAYSLTLPSDSTTRNFPGVLETGATNFVFNDYNITLANYYKISGDNGINVAIDSSGKGLDFTALRDTEEYFSGEFICKFKLTKKATTSEPDAE